MRTRYVSQIRSLADHAYHPADAEDYLRLVGQAVEMFYDGDTPPQQETLSHMAAEITKASTQVQPFITQLHKKLQGVDTQISGLFGLN